MLKEIKKSLSRTMVNLTGWSTGRKIVVIESDDWGTIRMPSAEVYKELADYGVRVAQCPYCTNDKLENSQDLEALFETLSSVKDSKGHNAILTANTIVANPDFDKIAASGFEQYFYEPCTETYKRYYSAEDIMGIIGQGQSEGVYKPQFHGREHVNVNYWMQALKDNMPETRFAFEKRLFGISKGITTEKRRSFLSSFDFDAKEELEQHKTIINEGLDLFENIFGYKSESFIAPNYTWHPDLERTLSEKGVKIIQGARAQQIPTENGITVLKNKMGNRNGLGQVYLIRNVKFEPSSNPRVKWVDEALKEVSSAFFHNKPAVISTHRLNFMGGMHEENRTKNLMMIKHLLEKIVKKYPDTEFMSSDQLGNLILSSK